ncbi:MAG: non-heme iron oxygenase ferredoxin subunit [Xanthobacteraceae bacterium]|nr:non-heme iron oxygenase ferredoxin subunit [Xanthobacteraceae bacterium]
MANATWVKVAPISKLPEGKMLGIEIGDLEIAVYHVDGQYYATENVCTHALALLTDGILDGDVVECPLHAGCFNVKTGAGMGDPITEDLRTYRVRVESDTIEVEIPAAS